VFGAKGSPLRDFATRRLKHVPIPDPEIKLTVYGCRAWSWRRWIRKDARAPQVVTREKHNSRNNADPPPLDSLMLFQ
jgi:hypothetical protein